MDTPLGTLSTLNQDDICSLVKRNEEHQHFDYKASMPWDESTIASIELVKDILALANSGGGFLVIGVAETPNGGFQFEGLSDEDAGTWEATRVGNKVRSFSDPPVSVRVQIVGCNDRRFAVVTVDGFHRVPHFCKKGFERDGKRVLIASTLYVRTVACESRPVQTAEELNAIIDRAVRTRHDEMLTAIRSVMIGASTRSAAEDRADFARQIRESLAEVSDPLPGRPYDAYYTDEMYPARFEEERFSRAQLQEALKEASTSYEGWPFLDYEPGKKFVTIMRDGLRYKYASADEDGEFNNTDRFFYWRLWRSGLLVVKSLAWEDIYLRSKSRRCVAKQSIIHHAAGSIDALVRIYSQLGVSDEEVTWTFNLAGVQNRHLTDPPNIVPYPGQNPTTDQERVGLRRTMSIEEWRAGLLDHIVDAVRDIFEQFDARFVNYSDVREEARTFLRVPARSTQLQREPSSNLNQYHD